MNARRPVIRDQRLIEGVIGSLGLFRGVAAGQLGEVAKRCWVLAARRGEVAARAEARLPGVFAVAYGTVAIVVRQGTGEERVVRLVHAGQSFGEPSALLGRAPIFEARAVTDAKLVVIPAAAIFALIDREPRAARSLVSILAERSVALLGELEHSGNGRGMRRLANYLDRLAPEGTETPPPCVIRLPASKTLIASRLDMTKETLSRLLRSLSEQDVIRVRGPEITVLDRARLRAGF